MVAGDVDFALLPDFSVLVFSVFVFARPSELPRDCAGAEAANHIVAAINIMMESNCFVFCNRVVIFFHLLKFMCQLLVSRDWLILKGHKLKSAT